jgi:hypothetical protein
MARSPVRFALIADLIASRKAPARSSLSKRIERALKRVSDAFSDEWFAKPMTTRGLDEVSGVLRLATHAFDIAVQINLAIWPQRFRFGLASGSIDVGERSRRASDMDGSAFHNAAKALHRAATQDLPFATELNVDDAAGVGLIEQIAALHASIIKRWPRGAAAVVVAYRELKTQHRDRRLGGCHDNIHRIPRNDC